MFGEDITKDKMKERTPTPPTATSGNIVDQLIKQRSEDKKDQVMPAQIKTKLARKLTGIINEEKKRKKTIKRGKS